MQTSVTFRSIWRVLFVNHHYDSHKFSPQANDTQHLQEKVGLCFSYFPSSWLFYRALKLASTSKYVLPARGLVVICPMNISQQQTTFE